MSFNISTKSRLVLDNPPPCKEFSYIESRSAPPAARLHRRPHLRAAARWRRAPRALEGMPHFRRWRKNVSQSLEAMAAVTRNPTVYSRKFKRMVTFSQKTPTDPRASHWFMQKAKNAEQARWDEKQSKLMYYTSCKLGEGEWPNYFKPRDNWLAWKRKSEGVPVN